MEARWPAKGHKHCILEYASVFERADPEANLPVLDYFDRRDSLDNVFWDGTATDGACDIGSIR